MDPTAGNDQIFTLFFQRMVNLIAIRYADPGIILQEFSWMGCISGPLVFVKNDLLFRLHVAGTVYPHVTLGTSTAAISVYKNRRLICLNDMVAVKQ